MTFILHQQGRKQGEGSFLPWVLLAATSAAAVVVRQRLHQRRREVTSKVGQWESCDNDDEDISELTTPLQEDQDMMETSVDFVPIMEVFREANEDHSNDETEQADTTIQSETMEL